MGQQQLLLLVLAIVIVGLAVVVGVSAFAENEQKAEFDRYTEMGVALSGDIIAFYQKPSAMGGAGQDAAAFAGLDMGALGYREDRSDTWEGFERSGIVSGGVVRYVAADTEHPFLHIHKIPLSSGDPRVEVHVFGPSEDCIVTRASIRDQGDWSDGGSDGSSPTNPNAAACSW
ncbi:hypothetical protein [Rubrivirga sp.]|uniref:hypothetical protein n=1 Tax=Rubrivirga sp. TaxID=1885344 RepID=UPI003C728F72